MTQIEYWIVDFLSRLRVANSGGHVYPNGYVSDFTSIISQKTTEVFSLLFGTCLIFAWCLYGVLKWVSSWCLCRVRPCVCFAWCGCYVWWNLCVPSRTLIRWTLEVFDSTNICPCTLKLFTLTCCPKRWWTEPANGQRIKIPSLQLFLPHVWKLYGYGWITELFVFRFYGRCMWLRLLFPQGLSWLPHWSTAWARCSGHQLFSWLLRWCWRSCFFMALGGKHFCCCCCCCCRGPWLWSCLWWYHLSIFVYHLYYVEHISANCSATRVSHGCTWTIGP